MNATPLLLLVEDEALLAYLLAETLQDGGYTVEVEGTGDAAIASVERLIGELSGLITDIRLPDGPAGWDIARHARMLKHDLPVIYMSGDSACEWAVNGVPKSVMLQKPFAIVQLVTAVSTLLLA